MRALAQHAFKPTACLSNSRELPASWDGETGNTRPTETEPKGKALGSELASLAIRPGSSLAGVDVGASSNLAPNVFSLDLALQ